MALFGIFKKGKGTAMPQPPKPMAKVSERHKDDLEKQVPLLEEGPLFPEIPNLELPELEPPKEFKLELPQAEEEKAPEHLPELEEISLEEEIPEELPELETAEYAPKEKRMPLFINVNIYSEMIGQLNTARAKLNEYASAAARVVEIRSEKDAAMEKWRNALEDIERKLLAVDRILFEGG